jgi:tripartite motif-containing protein 71
MRLSSRDRFRYEGSHYFPKITDRLFCVCSFAVVLIILGFLPPRAHASLGQSYYQSYCASCHPSFDNIITPNKKLTPDSLTANGISSVQNVVEKMRHPGPGMTTFDSTAVPDAKAYGIASYIMAAQPGTFLYQWGARYLFLSPGGVAVDRSENLYVADTGNNRIVKLDTAGKTVAQWGRLGSENGDFNKPAGVAVDENGNVYVADNGNCRIQKFDENGNFLAKWGSVGSGTGQFRSVVKVAAGHGGDIYVVDGGNNRVQKFDSSGVYLTQWGGYGTGDGQFAGPAGAAVDDSGNVYVVDDARVQKFDSNGGYITKWTGPYYPSGVAVDVSGNVYVTSGDISRNQVYKYDRYGTRLTIWGGYGSGNGLFLRPAGVAVDSSGNVYVVDTSNNRVQKFDSSGGFITQYGSKGSDNGQFSVIWGIAVDGAGNVFAADQDNLRIQKFDSSGNYITQWGSYGYGNGEFNYPRSIAVDGAGNLYVADDNGGNIFTSDRIQKFDNSGNYLTQWGGYGYGNGQFYVIAAVAAGISGNVYVSDFGSERIQKFDGDGGYVTQWGNSGSGNGQFNNPYGLALDILGNVYVADYYNHRVQKFDSNGNYVTQWGGLGAGNGKFNGPIGVAVDGSNNVYVTDRGNNRVQVFDGDGNFKGAWGSLGAGSGKFTNPRWLAVEPSGERVYVADDNNLIQVFSGYGGMESVADHFLVSAPADASQNAPVTFSVTALDSANNRVAGYSGKVILTSSDSTAILPADAILVNGSGTFSATFRTSGNQTITATDTASASFTGTSGNVSVGGSIGPATHFALLMPESTPSGVAVNFTVTALDAANKKATGYSGTVDFTSTDLTAILPSSTTLINGSGTFSTTLHGENPQTITATDTFNASIYGTSNPIALGQDYAIHAPGVPTHFAVSVPKSSTTGFAFSFSVTALDANNRQVGYRGAVRFTSSDGSAIFSSNATLADGRGTFSATLRTAGSHSITVVDSADASITGTSGMIWLNRASQTISLTQPAPATMEYGSNYTVSATASSSLPVTIKSSGSCSGGGDRTAVITMTSGSGFCTISYEQNGDASFAPAEKIFNSVTAEKASPDVMAWPKASAIALGQKLGSCVLVGGSANVSGAFSFASPETVPLAGITEQIVVFTPTNSSDYNRITGTVEVTTVMVGPPTSWTSAGSMASRREAHTATLLPSGKVLVAGGYFGNGSRLSSAELYDPATNSWSSAGRMSTERYGHTATLLANGKVLVAGDYASRIATAEVYDPETNSWSPAGSMSTTRGYHTATLLRNGKVLVVGGASGDALASADLYDPDTNSWTPVATMSTARRDHTATLLPSGRVLVAGGWNMNGSLINYLASAELYDPANNSWSSSGFMAQPRGYATSTLLPSGKVMVAGGSVSGSVFSSVELYDPATNSWSWGESMASVRTQHTATLLPSGVVLVAGGANDGYNFNIETFLLSAELYDPTTNSWSPASSMANRRKQHTATLLANGMILVAGGRNVASSFDEGLSSAEVYGAAGGDTQIGSNVVVPLRDTVTGGTPVTVTFATVSHGGSTSVGVGESGPALPAGLSPGNPPLFYDVSTTAGYLATLTVCVSYAPTRYGSIANLSLLHYENGSWLDITTSNNTISHVICGNVSSLSPFVVAERNIAYTLTYSADANGTISGATTQTVNAGGSGSQVTAVAHPGYHFVSWSDGVITAARTDTNVIAGINVTASFAANTMGVVWTDTGPMGNPRNDHTATLLQNGKVLVAGGYNLGSGSFWDLSSVELYDPFTNTWSQAAPMMTARIRHVAVRLTDGRVVVAGGVNRSGGIAGAELYDPATNSWSPAGSMSVPHPEDFTANLLPNGKVIVIGGYANKPDTSSDPNPEQAIANVDIYDPSTNSWAPGPPLPTARYGHTSTLLPNGTVLVAGGMMWTVGWFSSTNIYHPDTNSWTSGPPMSTTRVMHSALPLADGNVLVAGGAGGSGPSAEIYHWASNSWLPAGSMTYSRYDFTSTLLPSGKVLVTGGFDYGLGSAELYDPFNNQWYTAYSMSAGRANHTATLLPNGKVLVVQATSELYDANVDPDNHAPFISGSPGDSVTVGAPYLFRPAAFDPDGDALEFKIANKPYWADFDTTSGTLSGTPPAAEYFPGLVVSVSDRRGGWVSLPAININVDGIPVNGACGPAAGGTFGRAPMEGLCSAGTPTTPTGSGPWWWRCSGAYGGSNASCQASSNAVYSVVLSAGTGGTLAGAASQSVAGGGSSTGVRAVPDSGYYFADWTDPAGRVVSGANPVVFTKVADNITLTANFAPLSGTASPYSVIFLGPEIDASGKNHYALWGADANGASTGIIRDINVTSGIDASQGFSGFSRAGKWLLFAANDGANGRELWRTDGTAQGTEMLAELNPAPYTVDVCSPGSGPYCSARDCGACPGFSCGGDQNCLQELEMFGNNLMCNQSMCMKESGNTNFGAFISNEQKTFFQVLTDQGGGFQLWLSDGTATGTRKVKDFVYGHYGWAFVGDRLYFGADDGTYNGLWVLDGTTSGTTFLGNLGTRDSMAYQPFGDNVMLQSTAYANNIWTSDGTPAGTKEILHSSSHYLRTATSRYGFAVEGSGPTFDLYSLSGAVSQKTKLNTGSYNVHSIVSAVDDLAYFYTLSGDHYTGPWVTDGTVAGTQQIGDINMGNTPYLYTTKGVGSNVYLWSDNHVWGMDSYRNITSLLVGDSDSQRVGTRFANDASSTWFTLKKDGQSGLWKTDGTVQGTVLVKSLQPFETDYNDNFYLARIPLSQTGGTAGACGSAHAGTFMTQPTSGLCASGAASEVAGNGPWSWSCAGTGGGATASCSAGIESYAVSFRAGAGGSIAGTAEQSVNYGASCSQVTALAATGYHFVNWTDGSNSVLSSANPLTLTNVTGNSTVIANFALNSYSLTYSAGGNGTISGPAQQNVLYGGSGAAVTALPATGYHFVAWSDGILTATRTDNNVTADLTVTASFALNSYTLAYSANANGSISGPARQTILYGGNGAAVTAVPAAGYHFVSWSDGVLIATRTDTNVTADISVSASFAINRPDLTIALSHTGNFTQGQTGATYTITASNAGTGPTSGTVTVTDILPAGLTPTAMAGSGWTCSVRNLTCSRSSALAAGTSYPPITLNVKVAANAPATLANTANVSGGGESNTANNSASDLATITQKIPDLIVALSHTGDFTQGQTSATYRLTVSNSGNGPTTGTVTVVDSLPTGFTAKAISGSGWACTLGTLTCTRSNALAAGASYPSITITVAVANNAPSSVANVASVSGGGEDNASNDTATDVTTIVAAVPDLTVTSTHQGNFKRGQNGAKYTLTVRNIGTAATTGMVTVSDVVPSGVTATAMSGSGWSCNLSNTTCTRNDSLPSGGSYPALTVTVNVANTAPSSVTNIATVSGGGETVTGNDTANDLTTIK